jgi:hypothetical protein
MERCKKINKGSNTKMKKSKRNKNTFKKLFPTKEILQKYLFIDIDKQEITRLSTGNKLTFRLTGRKDAQYHTINFSLKGKSYSFLVHRLFFYWHYGYLPYQIDHIDGNGLNNKINNLRETNDSDNQRNKKKNHIRLGKKTSSRHKNVTWDKSVRNWRGRVRLNKKSFGLGQFDTEDEAGEAVNQFYIKNNLIDYTHFNDTPQQRARENIQFDPLSPEMNHLKDLFKNLEPLVDFK